MISRFVDWLDAQPPGRRRLYSLFIALTLLTLPCYAAGMFLLYFGGPITAPDRPAVVTPVAATAVDLTEPAPVPTPTEVAREQAPAEEDPTREPATPMLTLPAPPTAVVVTATLLPQPTTTTPPTLPVVTDTPPPTATPAATATTAPATSESPTSEPTPGEPTATQPPTGEPEPTDTPPSTA